MIGQKGQTARVDILIKIPRVINTYKYISW